MIRPMTLELLASGTQLTGGSRLLSSIALVALLAGGLGSVFPLYKSATLSPDSIERRTFWTGTVIGLALLFVAYIPDWSTAAFVVVVVGISLVAIALTKSNFIKIKGRIYALDAANREPDRPPALAKHEEDP